MTMTYTLKNCASYIYDKKQGARFFCCDKTNTFNMTDE